MVPAQAGDGDRTERGRAGLAGGSSWEAGLRRIQGPGRTTARQPGSTGLGRKTGLFQDQSESPTAPSGRPDPARLRGNVDRDETSPQSPSLGQNGSAERSGLAETHTLNPRSSGLGPDRSAPPHPLVAKARGRRTVPAKDPLSRFATAPPEGGASARRRSSPSREVARRAGGGLSATL